MPAPALANSSRGAAAATRALILTEAFERLGYCGTQLLILLYLAELFAAGPSGDVYARFSAWTGALEPTAMAAQVVAMFLAATQAAALIGAALARVVDPRKIVLLGGLLMAGGHFAMADPRLIAPALVLLIVGAGCTISNKLAQFGSVLARRGVDRAQGYAGYTIAVNVGALLAPLVCGTLAELWGWAWGFRAAGGSVLIGIGCYLSAWRWLPASPARPAPDHPAPDRRRWHAVAAIVLTLIPYVLMVAVLNQAYTLALLWGAGHFARDVGPFTIPITWILTIDGLAAIGGLLIARHIWRRRLREGAPLPEPVKLAVGGGLLAIAYAALARIAELPSPSLALFVVFFLLLNVAAGWIDPSMEAFTSRRAPPRDVGLMMGVFKASGVLAALLIAGLSRWFVPLGAPAFWAFNAALALGAVLLLLLIGPVIRWLLGRDEIGGGDADAPPDLAFATHAQRARQAGEQEIGIQQPR